MLGRLENGPRLYVVLLMPGRLEKGPRLYVVTLFLYNI
jgi:hypothetical protein